MIKLKAPEGVTQLSINGEAIEIKNGVCEVSYIDPFLIDNGFTVIEEEEKPKKRVKKEEEAE